VDLRNAGYKLAPVDTNLFPGGFNNLSTEMLPLTVQAAMAAIDKYCPDARNLLLIPESHTRNPFYLQNVQRLMQIFRQTGLHVRLGSLSPEVTQPTPLALPDGNMLVVEPLVRSANGRRVGLADFDPCTILLNNDLSAGIPSILENIHEQSLLPPVHAGWAVRRKSNHFKAFDEVAKKFGKLIDIDPWMVNPLHSKCGEVNFQEDRHGVPGRQRLGPAVEDQEEVQGIRDEGPEALRHRQARRRHLRHGHHDVKDASEVKDLNRKQRNKMSVIKDGVTVTDVMIQEGVPTFESINDAVAEPVVYMIDRYVVGGFYRVHAERGIDQNLNAPGSQYVPLAFAQQHAVPDLKAKPGRRRRTASMCMAWWRGWRLLAASLELERTDPDPEIY
jgi:glutamate--cysteine ligase